MPIPRLIHQTWKTDQVPAHWQASHRAWKTLPNFEYKLWTDVDNRAFIAQRFPWFLAQFDAYPQPIQRADAVRYFILFVYGGVYADLDLVPKTPAFLRFFDLVADHDGVVLPHNQSGHGVGQDNLTNCFMMSPPRHEFWRHVWRLLRAPFWWRPWKRAAACTDYFQVLFTTGPGIIIDAYQSWPERDQVYRVPSALIQPGHDRDPFPLDTNESIVQVLAGQSWHRADAKFFRAFIPVLDYWPQLLVGTVVLLLFTVLWMRFG
jgi:mannosyltransferase OCH1-like enzyme